VSTKEWQKCFYSNRPKPLPDEIRRPGTEETGNVSYENRSTARVQMERYGAEVEEFNRTAELHRKTAAGARRETLQFDGGWMLTVMNVSEGDKMEQVRKLAVPELDWLLTEFCTIPAIMDGRSSWRWS